MKLETAKRWLILFYEKIQENEKVLAELDSFMGGDGDHGENMMCGMTAVVNEVEPREFESTADLFKNAGMLLLTKSRRCLRNPIRLSIFWNCAR